MRSTLIVLSLAALIYACSATTYHVRPNNDWRTTLTSLQPGDEVIFYGGSGIFDQGSSRLGLTFVGSQNSPIVIRGATNETRPEIYRGDAVQNTVNIAATSQHFLWKNIDIRGGSLGLVFEASGTGVSNARFEDMKVSGTVENCIAGNGNGNYQNMTFRRIEMTSCGGTAECMYFGKNDASYYASGFLVENIYCHDNNPAVGTQGSKAGIQFKPKSFNNVIRNNVVRRVGGPCIITYDDYDQGANIIEGNFCDSSEDNGIQISAGAVVRNNIVIGSAGDGIATSANNLQSGKTSRNVKIVGNTVVNAGAYCLRTAGTVGNLIANNAVFGCTAGVLQGSATGYWFNNGAPSAPSGLSAETTILGSATAEMTNPASFDFYPKTGSNLIGNGDAAYVDGTDFNGNTRSSTPTLGAYEYTTATNPGWTIGEGFKPAFGGGSGNAPTNTGAPTPKAAATPIQPKSPVAASAPSGGSSAPTKPGAPGSNRVGNSSSAIAASGLIVLILTAIAILL